MKTTASRSGLLLITTTLAVATAQEPIPIPTQPTQPEAYRLYVGMDVQVPLGDEFEEVHDYRNKLVRYGDRADKLGNLPDIRFSYQTKLGKNVIQITETEFEQRSSNAQARIEAMRNQHALQDYVAQQGERQMAAMRRESMAAEGIAVTQTAPGLGPPSTGPDVSDAIPVNPDDSPPPEDYVNVFNDLEEMAMLTDSERYEDSIKYGADPAKDMLEVTTLISSPMPITNAYLVGLITYSTDDEIDAQTLVFSRVGNLGPEPRRVSVMSQGFPSDALVTNIDMHVFRNGRELVSNLSEKQISLTRDQALMYLTQAYLSENRWGEAPPIPVWDLAPEPLFAAGDPEEFDYSFEVEVDQTGQVIGIGDPGMAPSLVTAVVYDMVFYPALKDGAPVTGVVQINLTDFFQ